MFSARLRLLSAVFALAGGTSLPAAISVERSVGSARVAHVANTPAADLVLIDAGHHAGLRQGMVCVVTRAGKKVGEILLVDLRLQAASALILDLQSGEVLREGDSVAVKTVSSK